MTIQSYHDLDVWKKARILVKHIYVITKTFPKEEVYSLTSQIRRAVVSIPANIAEGYSRHGIKDYINFVSIAYGSSAELETHLLLAYDLEYISEKQLQPLLDEIKSIQKMLYSLRRSLQEKL